MVIKRGSSWAYEHQCTKNLKHVEGPFQSGIEAAQALKDHKENCGKESS